MDERRVWMKININLISKVRSLGSDGQMFRRSLTDYDDDDDD